MIVNEQMWCQAILSENSTIRQAIENLNQVQIKIVLVVDQDAKFIGTILDGDIRRGLLKGLDLDSNIESIVHRNPLVVPAEISNDLVMQLMVVNKIQQIPIVDDEQNLVGLHRWDNISSPTLRTNLMVIMAGGKGTRLLPHTQDTPKPMVLVAGKPMLEHIIERGKLEGFNHFVLAINHLGHIIENHFGNGELLGVKIEYLRELSPLGTVGALGLLHPVPTAPFVVTNGDVMTDIRYGELLDFHCRYQASATMAVRTHEWQHPFGVVQIKGVEIIGFEEKPMARNHINAGVYALSPDVLKELTADVACDMPILFERLNAKAKRTVAYPMHEPWLDVGRPRDLAEARATVSEKLL
ncbi:nucleotidyltransferase family protein [Oceanospirillaceae bacterium]|nr:nucleotidyltransferase family protein [Oceanospirillaceae bacterium]